jgi:hypothetical protein
MNKIQELQNQLSTEENDLKALGIQKKLTREIKNDKFLDHWLPQIQAKTKVIIDPKMDKYTLQLEKHGIVDYFPKSNRLLIRKTNKWKDKGIVLLINELKLQRESNG